MSTASKSLWLLLVGTLMVGCSENKPVNESCAGSIYQNVSAITCPLDGAAYNQDFDLAEKLMACTFNSEQENTCSLKELPLVGQNTTSPSLDDLMNRVVASEPWMADNFRFLLEKNPHVEDILLLSRAITAIVISNSIRPSHYNSATGAIYLDAAKVWLTEDQFKTINQVSDYRSSFGDQLQFKFLWRYTKNNQYSSVSNFTFAGDRTDDERVMLALSGLLYHEFAHANDYFPIGYIEQIANTTVTPLEANENRDIVSDQLSEAFPLSSDLLDDLAGIRYRGIEANDRMKAVTAKDFGDAMVSDRAAHFYSYTSQREDLAMAFEFMMMRQRFGIQVDTAVSQKPDKENPSNADYIIQWGQRDRVLSPELQSAIHFIMRQILPENLASYEAYILDADQPINIAEGTNWMDGSLIDNSKSGDKTIGEQQALEQNYDMLLNPVF